MLLLAFLALVAGSTFVTLDNWRKGPFCLVVIGLLQDPIRKLTPGTPSYLVLSTMPVWGAMVMGLYSQAGSPWPRFQHYHHRLGAAMTVFLVCLVPAAIRSLSYGVTGVQLAVIGGFSFGGAIMSILAGFNYFKQPDDVVQILRFYCVAVAVMLIGVPLEYLGFDKTWDALGTATLGMKWRRYFPGYEVKMIAGFFRSPDVMGWHAVALIMLAGMFALYTKGTSRFWWIALAGWGGLGGMLCGRRKMIFMVPLFLLCVFWVLWGRQRRVGKVLSVVVAAAVAGYFVYQQFGPNEAVEEYYISNTRIEFKGRVLSDTYGNLVTTYDQYGFWGSGLGTASQGKQHLSQAVSRNWQEGGLDRLLAELGVVGLVSSLWLALHLLKAIFGSVVGIKVDLRYLPLLAGLTGFVLANGSSFVISHQIFGDPFINSFFSFVVGVALSLARLGEISPASGSPVVTPRMVFAR